MQESYKLFEHQFIVTKKLKRRVLLTPTYEIFNPDNKRSQGEFYNKKLSKIAKQIAQQVGIDSTHLRSVVLRSEPGCVRQHLHTDFNPKSHLSKKRAGMIMAIFEHTYINLDVDKKIYIPPGSVFIFRGDTVHAGSAYEKLNVRVHFYIGRAPKNKTFPIERISKIKHTDNSS